MKRLSLTVFCVLSAIGVLQCGTAAATTYQGYVTNVTAPNGAIYVALNNGTFAGGSGSCPNGTGIVLAIPSTPSASDFGKTMMALAMSAKLTGLLVYAVGDGNCAYPSPYSGSSTEALIYFDLKG
jgi:hypothetical protein